MGRRKPYPSDVSSEEWALVAPHLCLMPEGCGQRRHPLRELFNGLGCVARCGIPWRAMPNHLPPRAAVHQQAMRWLRAGCFEAAARDLRAVVPVAAGRARQPTAAVLDSRTLRSTPESGRSAGHDGAKRLRSTKVHLAVDTLGHLPMLRAALADADDRAEVGRLAEAVRSATGQSVEPGFGGRATRARGPRRPQRRTALP